MLKRNSNFTLIELIVVIVVLGILAAIVIPNISSFQDEARQVQLTADARNVQTALDMFQAKSDSGTEQPLATIDVAGVKTAVTLVATHEEATGAEGTPEEGELVYNKLVDSAGADAPATLAVIDFAKLQPDFLRKTPKYVKNVDAIAGADALTGVVDAADFTVADKEIDYNKGQVVAGVLLKADGKSTSIVNFVANTADGLAIVR